MTTERCGNDNQANDALVKAMRSGSHLAWESFYEETFAPLYGFTRKKVETREDAADCASEAFRRLLVDIRDPAQHLDTYNSIVHRLYDHARGEVQYVNRTRKTGFKTYRLLKQSQKDEDAQHALGDLRHVHILDDEQLAAQNHLILTTLEQLKQKHLDFYEVLRLRFVCGLMPDEVAKSLGISRNLVDIRIRRGRKKLAKLFADAHAKAPPNTFPRYSVVEVWQLNGQQKAERREQKAATRAVKRASQPPLADEPT